jgi:hypothetical protein
MTKKLDFAAYWNTVGTDNITKVIEAVGSSIRHFHAVKNRRKAISPKRANEIIEAAKNITPGFAPDFALMVAPIVERKPDPVKGRKTPPSPAFLRAQSRASKAVAA